ncbi:hypothetical protein PGT21_007298 [Puccinia graminis f. sp. tritici]|uniref:Uncharacterized protein n=1 Tax=Puccinia graminis f. sp. tritici TaxID=56615 RepID=A0A5B0QX27_PUCGR|nr:hypothetical protein PGT21_007298 [Puccinia graminis f. sp. tritici]
MSLLRRVRGTRIQNSEIRSSAALNSVDSNPMQKIWRVRWLASLYLHLLSALVRGGLHQLVDVALSLKDEQGHNTIAFSAIGLGKPIKTLMLFGDDSGLEESSEGRNGRSPLLKSIREIKDEDHDFQPALKRTKLDLNLSLAPMLDQNPADIPDSSTSRFSRPHGIGFWCVTDSNQSTYTTPVGLNRVLEHPSKSENQLSSRKNRCMKAEACKHFKD